MLVAGAAVARRGALFEEADAAVVAGGRDLDAGFLGRLQRENDPAGNGGVAGLVGMIGPAAAVLVLGILEVLDRLFERFEVLVVDLFVGVFGGRAGLSERESGDGVIVHEMRLSARIAHAERAVLLLLSDQPV